MNVKTEIVGNITQSVIASEQNNEHTRVKTVILVTLALWLGLVSLLASQGAFVGSANSPPLPIFLGFAAPLAVFLAGYFGSRTFRGFILSADLRFVSAIQAWRWGGLGFLSLYANGVLPGLFAFPAGLGDMAIGITAPSIILALVRQPSFATSRRYKMWNILGIVDFAVAITMGTLCSGFVPAIAHFNNNVTTAAMARLPLILIPAYMVPIFTMLHLTALFQARHLAATQKHLAAFTTRKPKE